MLTFFTHEGKPLNWFEREWVKIMLLTVPGAITAINNLLTDRAHLQVENEALKAQNATLTAAAQSVAASQATPDNMQALSDLLAPFVAAPTSTDTPVAAPAATDTPSTTPDSV